MQTMQCSTQVVRGPASGFPQEGGTDGAPEWRLDPIPHQATTHRQVHVHCERPARRQTDVGVGPRRKRVPLLTK